jgi:hypothetical protein
MTNHDVHCWSSFALGAIAVLAATIPAAQAMDLAAVRQYGGVFSPDCPNYTGLRLKYLGDTLVIARGAREVTAGNVRVRKTFPGAGPAPTDFRVVLSGTVPGKDALSFTLFHNKDGLFAVVDAGPGTMAAVGPGVTGVRIRHCDPNRNALPGAPVAVMVFPSDMLRDKQFKGLYVAMLGPLVAERWLLQLTGPSHEARTVRVAGKDYQLLGSCKEHDCYDNSLAMLYSAQSKVLYGQGVSRGHPIVLGSPPPAVAAELNRLWRSEWRSGG